MADVIIDFIFNGILVKIPCNRNELMKNIFQRYLMKLNKNLKNICFLYKGYKINGDMKLEALNKADKEIQIFVVEMSNIKKDIIQQSKDVICPECGENCLLTFENYKMTLNNCKNNHDLHNILLEEFNDTQKINELTIICNDCKKINKAKVNKWRKFYFLL